MIEEFSIQSTGHTVQVAVAICSVVGICNLVLVLVAVVVHVLDADGAGRAVAAIGVLFTRRVVSFTGLIVLAGRVSVEFVVLRAAANVVGFDVLVGIVRDLANVNSGVILVLVAGVIFVRPARLSILTKKSVQMYSI